MQALASAEFPVRAMLYRNVAARGINCSLAFGDYRCTQYSLVVGIILNNFKARVNKLIFTVVRIMHFESKYIF